MVRVRELAATDHARLFPRFQSLPAHESSRLPLQGSTLHRGTSQLSVIRASTASARRHPPRAWHRWPWAGAGVSGEDLVSRITTTEWCERRNAQMIEDIKIHQDGLGELSWWLMRRSSFRGRHGVAEALQSNEVRPLSSCDTEEQGPRPIRYVTDRDAAAWGVRVRPCCSTVLSRTNGATGQKPRYPWRSPSPGIACRSKLVGERIHARECHVVIGRWHSKLEIDELEASIVGHGQQNRHESGRERDRDRPT